MNHLCFHWITTTAKSVLLPLNYCANVSLKWVSPFALELPCRWQSYSSLSSCPWIIVPLTVLNESVLLPLNYCATGSLKKSLSSCPWITVLLSVLNELVLLPLNYCAIVNHNWASSVAPESLSGLDKSCSPWMAVPPSVLNEWVPLPLSHCEDWVNSDAPESLYAAVSLTWVSPISP